MGSLIEVEDALKRVVNAAASLPRKAMEVAAEQADGMVLAEAVISDIDVPPYRKALMDGYAVRADDVSPGCRLRVVDEVTAGALPARELQRGEATRIMTGAPLPVGADAVVRVEDTTAEGDAVTIETNASPGDNLMEAGYCTARGDAVVPAGHRVQAHQVGLLCEVGAARVSVVAPPRVAVLSTGDELVSATEMPGPGQIRNTNAPLIAALAERDGAVVTRLGVAEDDAEEIAAHMRRGLEQDILILSGGVSAGIRDLVPGTLAALDVRPVFHGVRLKPGKPMWFGTRGSTLVFGLPGNPVSSLVCYHLFVRPAVDRLSGRGDGKRIQRRMVASDSRYRSGRRTFHPARLVGDDQVELLPWKGSVDQRILIETDSFVDLPGDTAVVEGMVVDVHLL